MTPALDIEALRAELATRHQALVGANDPIFLAVALNELVLSRYLERIHELNAAARTEAAVALTRYLEVAKSAAATIVSHNAQYIADQVRAKVDEELARAASQAMTYASAAQIGGRVARWAAAIALIAAGVCVGSVVMLAAGINKPTGAAFNAESPSIGHSNVH
jgi:hypothetical protein